MYLVSSDEIRTLENSFIKEHNCSLELMEKAGAGLANEASKYTGPYLIVCGKGNNGGDGLVAARHLHKSNKEVYAYLLSDKESISADSKVNLERLPKDIQVIQPNKNLNIFQELLNKSNTIIECIIGTGIKDPLSEDLKLIVEQMNSSNKNVIACDVPLGVNPNNGKVNSHCLKASNTVTFGYSKVGLHIHPAKEYCGNIKVIDIGLPKIETRCRLLDNKYINNLLPNRSENSNKGTFGKTLVISGSKDFPGAALLTCKAATSIGSGLTMLSSPEAVFSQITKGIPEATHIQFTIESIIEATKAASSVVIGPGLGNNEFTREIVLSLLQTYAGNIVIDADAINVLADKTESIIQSKANIILTPHPKELSRLLNISLEEVLNNKLEITKSTATKLKSTLLLKGAGSIISSKDGELFISPFSNSALAKGGTGDVLAGLIGGLISQGVSNINATKVGVYIHGLCAEIIKEEKTEYCLLPQDLISYLPKAIKVLRK